MVMQPTIKLIFRASGAQGGCNGLDTVDCTNAGGIPKVRNGYGN